MKHKFLTVFFAIVAALCLCFGLAACGKGGGTQTGPGAPHTHSFTDYVYNNDATCTTNGTETAKCACGETDTREKADTAFGHDYQQFEAKPATCAEAGWNAYQECNRCHVSTFADYIPAVHVRYSLKIDGTYSVVDLSSECTDSEIVIPDTYMGKPVTSIEKSAFRDCSGLTSVEIPDGVTEIEAYAFYGCSQLKSISIPDSVTEIGSRAFYGTAFYEEASHWDESGVLYIGNHLIKADEDIISGLYTIRAGTKTIADSAFRGHVIDDDTYMDYTGCPNLIQIVIPNSVTSIGDSAFCCCSGLTGELKIPDGVTSIGEYLFYGCSQLKSLSIPDGVTSIGREAFYGCSQLKNISIPDGVTSIGSDAFYRTAYYEEASYLDESGVRYIGNYLIATTKKISGAYTIREGTKAVEDNAFFGCSDLTSITIPNSVTSIGEYLFYGCSQLKSISIPDSVVSIGKYAFSECSGLMSVTIPDGVTSIGIWTFSDCSMLTSVVIPDSVTSIGSYAFDFCRELTDIQFKGTVEAWQAIEKGYRWDNPTGNYTVTCTDGTVDKKGNVTYFE